MRLILALFFVVAFRIENSAQNIYNDKEDRDEKCTIHSSDNYQTRLEVEYKNSKSKGMPFHRKIRPVFLSYNQYLIMALHDRVMYHCLTIKRNQQGMWTFP